MKRYQAKIDEEERVRKEAEEKAKQEAEAAKAASQEEKMQVDETGDKTQTKEKSPKGKK